jgi:hypothetical protein
LAILANRKPPYGCPVELDGLLSWKKLVGRFIETISAASRGRQMADEFARQLIEISSLKLVKLHTPEIVDR